MLTVLFIALTVIASLVTIGQGLWAAGKFPDFVATRLGHVSWGRVGQAMTSVIEQIRASGWSPEVVIGIGRTGSFAAALLLENMRLVPPDIELWALTFDTPPRTLDERDLIAEALPPLRQLSKKILVLDSETYSGNTMANVLAVLRAKGVPSANIKTASFFTFEPGGYRPYITNLTVEPDFIGARLGRPVIFPWAITPEVKRRAREIQEQRWRGRPKR